MTKPAATTDTMQELWLIKDETAVRFQTVAAYFEHLGLSTQHPPRKVKTVPKKVSRNRQPKVLQAH
jgi:hypothetical protein